LVVTHSSRAAKAKLFLSPVLSPTSSHSVLTCARVHHRVSMYQDKLQHSSRQGFKTVLQDRLQRDLLQFFMAGQAWWPPSQSQSRVKTTTMLNSVLAVTWTETILFTGRQVNRWAWSQVDHR